jgi:hypothetical protein
LPIDFARSTHDVTARFLFLIGRELEPNDKEVVPMAKKSRGGRMKAAKVRAAKKAGGKGRVKNRKVGKKIMST